MALVRHEFQPDRGYSWVVLFAAFMLNVQYAGGVGSVGVYLVEFMDYFLVSKAATALLAGLLLCTGFVLGFPIGWMCKYFGFRPVAIAASVLAPASIFASSFAPDITMLYVTYGIITSTALATLHNTGSIAVQKYFHQKRALASGVSVCGVSVGVFVWAPFTRWTIDLYGWRGALVIGAGVQLHSLVFACLLRPIPNVFTEDIAFQTLQKDDTSGILHCNIEKDPGMCMNPSEPEEHPEQTGLSDKSKFKKMNLLETFKSPFSLLGECPSLVPYIFGVILIQAGHITPYSLIPVRAQDLEIDKTLAASLVSMLGVASLCARAMFGIIGDSHCINRTLFCGLSGLVAGGATALSIFLLTYTPLAIYAGVLGIASAPYIALQAAAMVDIVGVANAETGIAYLSLSLGTAHILALSLSGFILDRLTDPKYPFLVFGVGEILGGAIIILTATFSIARTRNA